MIKKDITDWIFENLLTIIFVLGIGFFFWFFEPKKLVPMEVYFWSVGPLLIISVISIKFIIMNLNHDTAICLPKLKMIHRENIFIFEESPFFSHNSAVSLYIIDDYEQFLGTGYVEAVLQGKKTLQVRVMNLSSNIDLQYIKENKSKICLKPSIPWGGAHSNNSSEGDSNE